MTEAHRTLIRTLCIFVNAAVVRIHQSFPSSFFLPSALHQYMASSKANFIEKKVVHGDNYTDYAQILLLEGDNYGNYCIIYECTGKNVGNDCTITKLKGDDHGNKCTIAMLYGRNHALKCVVMRTSEQRNA